MGRSARLPDLDEEEVESPLRQILAAVGGALARNPAVTGGTTAFLVALSFVSANALWYQPHFHEDAFFVTRIVSESDLAREGGGDAEAGPRIVTPAPRPDPVVAEVQQALAELDLYAGAVDGQAGPATRRAIEAFQAANGMPVTGRIDAGLVARLSARDETAAIVEAAAKAPVPERLASAEEAEAAARIRKVQAGLKAFGNAIEVDGVAGTKTRAAIKEFQSLFGLPVTGEPDEALYAKMREVGLTD